MNSCSVATLRSGSVLYAAAKDLHGWGPTAMIAKQHRCAMRELIGGLRADAKIDGHPIHMFSRTP